MRQRAAVSLALGIASTSCGAKTGLTTPCLVRAVTEKPEVVLVMDRSSSTEQFTRDGAPLIEAIRSAGGTAIVNGDDVADWDGAKRLVAAAINEFGAHCIKRQFP